MDIWEEMYLKAKAEYHPEDVSPFISAHHVVCAVQAENGDIYTGFCIEGASGAIALCAERVASLNMYIQSAVKPWLKGLLCLEIIRQRVVVAHAECVENFYYNFLAKIKIRKYL